MPTPARILIVDDEYVMGSGSGAVIECTGNPV